MDTTLPPSIWRKAVRRAASSATKAARICSCKVSTAVCTCSRKRTSPRWIASPALTCRPGPVLSEETRNLIAFLAHAPDWKPEASLQPIPEIPGGVDWQSVAQPKPGEWPTYHGQEGGNRYTELSQITPANVRTLAPKWIYSLGQRPLARSHAGRRRRRDVCHQGQFGLRAGCEDRPRNLALHSPAVEEPDRRRIRRDQSRCGRAGRPRFPGHRQRPPASRCTA